MWGGLASLNHNEKWEKRAYKKIVSHDAYHSLLMYVSDTHMNNDSVCLVRAEVIYSKDGSITLIEANASRPWGV